MKIERIRQAEAIFEEAVKLPPAERATLIDEQCADDAELRDFVIQLISNDQAGMGEFLQAPVIAGGDDLAAPAAEPQFIGSYEIIRQLGRGGMGTVYLARQQHPRRTVALKILQPGLASNHLMHRLRRESELLGRLHHPGIAHVYEAGTTTLPGPLGQEVEQPFYAMEYIEGTPCTQFAQERQLGLRARLELFVKVCAAVQHAHDRNIIHRDLKPANVLVEADGQPKILDFGIARTTDADVRSVTLHTNTGQFLGTLAYMSPEQMSGDSSRVDARTDVYALGVMLYELLADRLPHDVRQLSIPDAIRLIQDEEPASLRSISHSLRGEIEIIANRALEKDRLHRYASAAALADDIQRYLHDEPIAARRPSTLYQMRKFAKRHRSLVAGVSAALIALTAGLVVALLALIEASAQRDVARSEAAKANTVIDLLDDMLSSANPLKIKGPDYTVAQLLDDFATTLPDRLREQPEVEGIIRTTIGKAYRGLARFDEAKDHLQAALELQEHLRGGEHPDVAAGLTELSDLYIDLGKRNEAAACATRALEIRRAAGVEHELATARNADQLGMTHLLTGDFEASEKFYRAALATRRDLLGDDHVDLASSLHNVALVLDHRGRYLEAEPLYREALRIQQGNWGSDHPEVARTLFDLAASLTVLGSYDEAEALAEQSLAVNRKLFGDDHPSVAGSYLGLAFVRRKQADYRGAEEADRAALRIYRALHAKDHSDLAIALSNLGGDLSKQSRLEEAEPLIREALDMRVRIYGKNHPGVASIYTTLGRICAQRGDVRAAARHYETSLEIYRGVYSGSHQRTAATLCSYADLHLANHDPAAAEPLLVEAFHILDTSLPPGHERSVRAGLTLGKCLSQLGKYEAAEQTLLETHESVDSAPSMPDSRRLEVRAALAQLYADWQRPDEAAKWKPRAASRHESR